MLAGWFCTGCQYPCNTALLVSLEATTLSILALESASPGTGLRESAGAISLIIMLTTVGVALVAWAFGLRVGVRHR